MSSVCMFCRLAAGRGPSQTLGGPLPGWQQTRSISHLRLRQRKPRRMSLSPKVGQPTLRRFPEKPRSKNSPWRAMNQKTADFGADPRNTRSAAQQKRTSLVSKIRGEREPQKRDRQGFHALKMQKALVEVPYGQRNVIKAKIEEKVDFSHFPLMTIVQEGVTNQALAGLQDISPTPIQRLAIPAILGNETRAIRRRAADPSTKQMDQFLLAAETGSGKTLAYLLPILHDIKRQEIIDNELEAKRKLEAEERRKSLPWSYVEPPPLTTGPHRTTARPKAIIILPTSELVAQVGAVAKSLSHTIKFRAAMISAAYTPTVIRSRLFSPNGIDLLVTTPRLLASISESDPNILSRVTHLVIDEADSLLDRSFAPTTSTIIDKTTPSLQKLILCSATIPRSLDSYLRNRFPDMRRLVTPHLHAIPRRIQLTVVDVEKQPYLGNKLLACADTIWSAGKPNPTDTAPSHTTASPPEIKRILVFVNEREKSQEVADYLVSKGIQAVCLNRDTPESRKGGTVLDEFTKKDFAKPEKPVEQQQQQQQDVVDVPLPRQEVALPLTNNNEQQQHLTYKPFTAPRDPEPPLAPAKRKQLANTRVLVTTDLGSRGIDTLAVKTVILFDVPHSTIDFIHRLGRTGRMGMRGRGIVLVGKKDRRDVVREVKDGMFKGQALI